MKSFTRLLLLALLAVLPASCYYSHPNRMDHWKPADGVSVDSVEFRIAHHYWKGSNFETTDSMRLSALPPGDDASRDGWVLSEYLTTDSILLAKHEKIVVADIRYVPADSIDSVWVKVARDQLTQGWAREKSLMGRVVADDVISRFIHTFSGLRSTIFASTAGALVLLLILSMLWRNRQKGVRSKQGRKQKLFYLLSAGLLAPGGWNGAFRSFYPTLLCLVASGAAALYGSIQYHVPGTWVEFYFHPSLNPMHADLPLLMRGFLLAAWLLLVVSVAVVIDLCRREGLGRAAIHVAGLGCNCIILYMVFTLTTPRYGLSYGLLALYWAFALWRYRRLHRPTYYCGNCGHSLPGPGECPKCGAVNQQ